MNRLHALLSGRPGFDTQRFARYIAVGLASTGTYFVVFVAMIELAGSAIWLAACAAFVAGTVVSYLGNAIWTFGQKAGGASAARFMTVVAASFTVNLLIAAVLELLGVHYLIIFCVEAVALTLMNYAGHMLWTFAPHRASPR